MPELEQALRLDQAHKLDQASKLDQALAEVAAEMADRTDRGDVASYLPQLGKVDPKKFGIAAVTNDGHV
ncbi:glutaminase, partial [Mesorhizobium sp. M7A.T.Ca.US.000.02.2.1]